MRTMVYTTSELYLDYRFNVNAVVINMIGEKIKELIYKYGPNLDIRITKIKHVPDASAAWKPPFTIINGYVRCHLRNDNQFMYLPEEVEEYLKENWFDYQIDFEKRD